MLLQVWILLLLFFSLDGIQIGVIYSVFCFPFYTLSAITENSVEKPLLWSNYTPPPELDCAIYTNCVRLCKLELICKLFYIFFIFFKFVRRFIKPSSLKRKKKKKNSLAIISMVQALQGLNDIVLIYWHLCPGAEGALTSFV